MLTAVQDPPRQSLAALMRMTRPQLEALYRRSEPGPIPDGESRGLASALPGTATGELSEAVFSVFWQGKVFDRTDGSLVNKILGFLKGVKARVFTGDSWFDGRPAILIDYRGTSWLCAAVRDEIRQVGPGLYLGFAYLRTPGRPRAPLMFALDFNGGSR